MISDPGNQFVGKFVKTVDFIFIMIIIMRYLQIECKTK